MNSTINISIIIPTKNREEVLWETVEKAIQAITNRSAEIIIINDGDEDLKTPPDFFSKIKCYNNPSKGVSSARNFGASLSSGNLLFFIDDDMWINPEALDWITANVDEQNFVSAVYNINWIYPAYLDSKLYSTKIGNYLLASGYNTMWGRMNCEGTMPAMGLYKYPGRMIGSGSFVIVKKLFTQMGGYNEKIIFAGEDVDFATRLMEQGIKIYCVFDVTLYHNHNDRLHIDSYFERISNGYASEFSAIKSGDISNAEDVSYKYPSRLIFDFFRVTEKVWFFLLKKLPCTTTFTSLNNRFIGLLSGLQKYKQWRNIIDD